jgi:hypothetical protein
MLSDAAARTGGDGSSRRSGIVSRIDGRRAGNRPASVQHVDAERKEQSGVRDGVTAATGEAGAHAEAAATATAIGHTRSSRVMIAPRRLELGG